MFYNSHLQSTLVYPPIFSMGFNDLICEKVTFSKEGHVGRIPRDGAIVGPLLSRGSTGVNSDSQGLSPCRSCGGQKTSNDDYQWSGSDLSRMLKVRCRTPNCSVSSEKSSTNCPSAPSSMTTTKG
jgi:hypothetical protein